MEIKTTKEYEPFKEIEGQVVKGAKALYYTVDLMFKDGQSVEFSRDNEYSSIECRVVRGSLYQLSGKEIQKAYTIKETATSNRACMATANDFEIVAATEETTLTTYRLVLSGDGFEVVIMWFDEYNKEIVKPRYYFTSHEDIKAAIEHEIECERRHEERLKELGPPVKLTSLTELKCPPNEISYLNVTTSNKQ